MKRVGQLRDLLLRQVLIPAGNESTRISDEEQSISTLLTNTSISFPALGYNA